MSIVKPFVPKFHLSNCDVVKPHGKLILSNTALEAALMKNGKDCSAQIWSSPPADRQWIRTRRRTWEEDSFAALAVKHANLFNGIFSELSITCLRRVAENSSVPSRLLEQLAAHPDPSIREAVGDNPNTPEDTLFMLASDECVDVRYAMAENHNLPLAVVSLLLEDENPYVACRARATIDRLIGGTLFEPGFWSRGKRTRAVG